MADLCRSLIFSAALAVGSGEPGPPCTCYEAQVTGYIRTEHGPRTFDGTPIWTDEPIVAASWNIPIDSTVLIDGLPGVYRVADRGSGLGSSGWIDVAVWSRADAYALTGRRSICVRAPAPASPQKPCRLVGPGTLLLGPDPCKEVKLIGWSDR